MVNAGAVNVLASVSEEPSSKRQKVKASEHVAELADGMDLDHAKPARPSISVAAASSIGTRRLQQTLTKGMRVKLCGFAGRPFLNGKTGKLEEFHPGHARWLVSLEDGSQKYVLSANLLPDGVGAVATIADHGPSGSVDATADASSFTATRTLPIHDCVRAHFQFMKREALRSIEELTGKTCEEVSRHRTDVDQLCSKHQRPLQQYCEMDKPTNYDQQLERNGLRERLQEVGRSVMTSMQRLLEASGEPAAALETVELDLLAKIDATMDMLAELRADTIASFQDYAEKLEVDRKATKMAISGLAPAVHDFDKFMQCVSEEVQTEKENAEKQNTDLLEKRQKEENAFRDANDSPSRNPLYAKVQEEIAALTQRMHEQASAHDSHMSMMQEWDLMLVSVPSKQLTDSAPKKRTFWSHLKCSTRAAAAST
jgi:hypothetical protein